MSQNAIELINRFWVEKEKIFDLEPNGEKSTKSRRFSVDLICGLPLETKASFFEGLKIVLDCGADHVSLYSLTLEENTALFDAVENGTVELPDTEETDGWWIDACELLEKSGFKQYEVSNFAKEGCFSRHNMTYWRMEPYIGIGAGATGTVKNLRYTNTSVIEHWIKNFADEKENLSTETQKFEYLMMGFRTFEGVDEDEFERRFGEKIEKLPFRENYVTLIKPKNLGISAKEAYTKYSLKENKPKLDMTEKMLIALLDKENIKPFLHNDLEFAVFDDYVELQKIKQAVPNAIMSGSGSTYFALENIKNISLDNSYEIFNDLEFIEEGVGLVNFCKEN